MSIIKRFEDIEVWKKARILAQKIYEVTSTGNFAKDFTFTGQIRNSSGSIMDNIAEGFERDVKQEFIYFLSVSKGSTGEVKSQLYRALDVKYITDSQFKELFEIADETGKMLKGFIEYLKSVDHKGSKFKTPKLKPLNTKFEI
jgi:four helix bundle protein